MGPDRTPLSEAQYRLVIERAPLMIWRRGLDARCDYVNARWLAFTGRALEDEIGEGWWTGVHPDDLEACVRAYASHREAFEAEYRLRRRDGSYRYVLERAEPFTAATGEVAGFLGSSLDIDDRRQADAKRTRFVDMLAHELRTPLTALGAYTESVRRSASRSQPVSQDVPRAIARQIDRCAMLIDELSDTARIELGRPLDLDLRPVDLGDVVLAAASLQRDAIAARIGAGVRHVVDLEMSGPATVYGDARRLGQAVLHVLENAVKFSPAGGSVRVSVDRAGAHHVLCVSDRGIGIPVGDLPLLGSPYVRGSNAAPERFPGIGVGLALTREIVEQHGGRLRITSKLGRGTTVTIFLPVQELLA